MNFIELGRANMRQKERNRDAEDREEQKARRAIEMAALEASMRNNGLLPEGEAERITLPGAEVQAPMSPDTPPSAVQVPYNVTGGKEPRTETAGLPELQGGMLKPTPTSVARPVQTDALAPGLERLGNTGYVRDPRKTPQAIAAKKDAEAEQSRLTTERRQLTSRTAALRALYPESDAAELEAIAADDVAFRQAVTDARKPDPMQTFKAQHDYRVNNPMPSRARPAAPPQTRRDPNIITLERQISEADKELARTQSAVQRLDAAEAPTPAQSRTVAALQARQSMLLQRRDSLVAKRDELAGAQMGTAPAPRPGTNRKQLTDRERRRATSDPRFAAFLRGKGYTPQDWR